MQDLATALSLIQALLGCELVSFSKSISRHPALILLELVTHGAKGTKWNTLRSFHFHGEMNHVFPYSLQGLKMRGSWKKGILSFAISVVQMSQRRETDPITNKACHCLTNADKLSALVHSVFQVQSNYIKLSFWLFHLPPGPYLPLAGTSMQQHQPAATGTSKI